MGKTCEPKAFYKIHYKKKKKRKGKGTTDQIANVHWIIEKKKKKTQGTS